MPTSIGGRNKDAVGILEWKNDVELWGYLCPSYCGRHIIDTIFPNIQHISSII